VQFIDNLNLERGLSSFDQRNNLQTTFLLSSPVGVHGLLRNGGWAERTLTGWTVSGTFTAASGTPLTALVAGNLSNTAGLAGSGSTRAEATGLPISGGGYAYFNLAAFTTPSSGEFGNAGRDTIPGPFHVSFNSALNRAFRFGDTRRQLQLRLSATNALNHAAITSFGTTVNSATYGLPTAATATRTVQLLMRFSFETIGHCRVTGALRRRTAAAADFHGEQQLSHRGRDRPGQIRPADRRPEAIGFHRVRRWQAPEDRRI